MRITRKNLELLVKDNKGRLLISFLGQRQGSLEMNEKWRVDLKGEDIEFFAGMILDRAVADASGKVDLKEPYPFIIRVKWDGLQRILSFYPWEEGGALASIRLSPLEARKVGKLAERTVFVNHLIRRLALER